jgi:DHA2 family multidrug resistance protein
VHQINQGLGMAFIFVPLTTLTMDPIPKPETGYATSLYSVTRNIGSSIGISFVTTWIARRSQFHQSLLVDHVTPHDPGTQQMLDRARLLFLSTGSDSATARQRALAALYGAVQQQAALLSFLDVFRVMGALFLIIVPLVLLLRRGSGPGRPTRRAMPERAGDDRTIEFG